MFFTTYDFLPPEEEIDLRDETVTYRADFNYVFAEDGGDALAEQGSSVVFGTEANDVIFGSDADEVIEGGAGGDVIFGDGASIEDYLSLEFALDTEQVSLAFDLAPMGDVG